jgi:hypothetical protein
VPWGVQAHGSEANRPAIPPEVIAEPVGVGKRASVRSAHTLARLLGDVNAVKKGTVGKRVVRRQAGKVTGRGLGKLFR